MVPSDKFDYSSWCLQTWVLVKLSIHVGAPTVQSMATMQFINEAMPQCTRMVLHGANICSVMLLCGIVCLGCVINVAIMQLCGWLHCVCCIGTCRAIFVKQSRHNKGAIFKETLRLAPSGWRCHYLQPSSFAATVLWHLECHCCSAIVVRKVGGRWGMSAGKVHWYWGLPRQYCAGMCYQMNHSPSSPMFTLTMFPHQPPKCLASKHFLHFQHCVGPQCWCKVSFICHVIWFDLPPSTSSCHISHSLLLQLCPCKTVHCRAPSTMYDTVFVGSCMTDLTNPHHPPAISP